VFLYGVGLAAYFSPGDVPGGDGHSHVGRTWLCREIVAHEHAFPIWTNSWYCGYPLCLYYGFLYYLSGALASLALAGNVFLGTKAFLWAVHIASGLSMYACVKLLTRSPPAAAFAATFYSFSLQHLGIIVHSGALPLSLVFLLLPSVCCVFELFSAGRLRLLHAGALASIFLALLVFTHIQYGVFSVGAFFVLAATRCVVVRACGDGVSRQQHAGFLGLTACFFTALTAWFLVPLITEQHYLVLSASDPGTRLLGGFSAEKLTRALGLVTWSKTSHDWEFYYTGAWGLLLALAGCLAVPKQRNRASACYCFLFCAGAVWLLRVPRFVSIWFFFACLMSGYGFSACTRRLDTRFASARPYIQCTVGLLLLIDLGPTLPQRPYRTIDNSLIKHIQKTFTNKDAAGRILVLTSGRDALWRSLDTVNTHASSPFGGIPQAATTTYPYSAAIVSKLAKEVLDGLGRPSAITFDGLRLLNITSVCGPGLSGIFHLPGAYPAWFSRELKKATDDACLLEKETCASIRIKFEQRTLDYSYTDYVIRTMGLDGRQPVARKTAGPVLHGPCGYDCCVG